MLRGKIKWKIKEQDDYECFQSRHHHHRMKRREKHRDFFPFLSDIFIMYGVFVYRYVVVVICCTCSWVFIFVRWFTTDLLICWFLSSWVVFIFHQYWPSVSNKIYCIWKLYNEDDDDDVTLHHISPREQKIKSTNIQTHHVSQYLSSINCKLCAPFSKFTDQRFVVCEFVFMYRTYYIYLLD